jgi:hypothetical protein
VRVTATDLNGLSVQSSFELSVVNLPGVIGVAAKPQSATTVRSGDAIDLLVSLNEAVEVQGRRQPLPRRFRSIEKLS